MPLGLGAHEKEPSIAGRLRGRAGVLLAAARPGRPTAFLSAPRQLRRVAVLFSAAPRLRARRGLAFSRPAMQGFFQMKVDHTSVSIEPPPCLLLNPTARSYK